MGEGGGSEGEVKRATQYMIVQDLAFTRVCVDSSRTVLEHHRSFTPFVSVLIAAELY